MEPITNNLNFADLSAGFQKRYAVNHSYLQKTKFCFVSHATPHLTLFCQNVDLPGVNGNPALQPTPLIDIPRAGDKIMFDPLTITFLIDEDLKVYEELFNWMTGYMFPQKDKQYSDLKKRGGPYADLSMIMLKNSNNDNLKIRFEDAFPVSLSPISMSVSEDATSVITADVTFYYKLYRFERDN